MVILELSFQFPIKRDGASPVVAAAAVVAASGVAAAESDAIADGLAAGAAGASSLFFPFEITIAPSARTPTSTNKRTLLEDPCFGAADGLVVAFAATGRAEELGVVVTLTRDPLVVGTGGITTLEDVDFLAADFFTAFLALLNSSFLHNFLGSCLLLCCSLLDGSLRSCLLLRRSLLHGRLLCSFLRG